MTIEIPKLDSKFIPVYTASYSMSNNIQFWKTTDKFRYPNMLMNLMTITSDSLKKMEIPEDMFLLTDSGGFQVISGQCNIDWKESLLKQIELNATKIFSFDTPPVKRKTEGLNDFTYMNDEETKKQISDNIDIAIQQSEFLRDNYPESRKRFCYILHGRNREHWDYNFTIIAEKLGSIDKYNEYFPGGITYAIKSNDILTLAIAAAHANKHFISKGKYVHFLGCGSFNKMIVLVRNKISTFDASSCLQGAMTNTIINQNDSSNKLQIPSTDIKFNKQFCLCPVCSSVDYNKLSIEENSNVGKYFSLHNLWQMLEMNIFLDAIKRESYTEIVKKSYKLNKNVLEALEFCDLYDDAGFDIAYNKYKNFLKKDETKQNTLF